jgi:hypothetical protein
MIGRTGALCFAFLMIAAPGVSWAEVPRFSVAAGVWFPEWKISMGGEELSSEYGAVVEPAVAMGWGKAFSGVRLGTSGFSLGDNQICDRNRSDCVRLFNLKADLFQLEFAAGYSPVSWLGSYVGILYQRQDITYLSESGKVALHQSLSTGEAGVLVQFPVRRGGELLYGKAAFVGLEMKDTIGGLLEGGVGYPLRRVPVMLSMMLKYQSFYYKSNDFRLEDVGRTRTRDTWLGLSAGVSYQF